MKLFTAIVLLLCFLNISDVFGDSLEQGLAIRTREFYEAVLLGDERHAWNMRDHEAAFNDPQEAYDRITRRVRKAEFRFSDIKVIALRKDEGDTIATVAVRLFQMSPEVRCYGLRWVLKNLTWYWSDISIVASGPCSP